MKFWPLLWANLLRKKVRSTLTLGSYAVALFLFGLLATIQTAFNQGLEVAGADRLIVRNKLSLIMPLPFSYKERILQVHGIKSATFATWFGGVYQNEKNFFPQFAIEKETWPLMYPEFRVPRDQWMEFLKDREGCFVGRQTAEKFHWKIGDRVPLIAPIWGGTWEFNVRGIYTGTRKEDDITQFWFRWDYLDERRDMSKGTVGWYVLRVNNPDEVPQIVSAIDGLFANSAWETATETERSFAAGFVKQMGNIQLLILSIGGVVFFTLMLVTGNTMAMSVRERTGEWAVLKTVGFKDFTILILVLSESLIYSIIGGGLGLLCVKLFTFQGDPTGGFLPIFYLAPQKILLGAMVAVAVGLVSGSIPAILAMRLKIVDALRRL